MKKIYFKFYDQLPEPISTWAKENWDEQRTNKFPEPISLSDALVFGFPWSLTKQVALWAFVYYHTDPETLLSDCKQEFPELFKKTTGKRVKIQIKQNRDGTWRRKLP